MSHLIDFYLDSNWQTKALKPIVPTLPDNAMGEEPDQTAASLGTAPSGRDDSDLSSYTCHSLLKGLCERLMRNGYEAAMCRLAQDSLPGKNLMLASLDDSLSSEITKISERYAADFPPQASSANSSATVIVDAQNAQLLEVVTRRVLEDDKDYRASLAEYNSLAAKPPP